MGDLGIDRLRESPNAQPGEKQSSRNTPRQQGKPPGESHLTVANARREHRFHSRGAWEPVGLRMRLLRPPLSGIFRRSFHLHGPLCARNHRLNLLAERRPHSGDPKADRVLTSKQHAAITRPEAILHCRRAGFHIPRPNLPGDDVGLSIVGTVGVLIARDVANTDGRPTEQPLAVRPDNDVARGLGLADRIVNHRKNHAAI
jgi:hypothetical protein